MWPPQNLLLSSSAKYLKLAQGRILEAAGKVMCLDYFRYFCVVPKWLIQIYIHT